MREMAAIFQKYLLEPEVLSTSQPFIIHTPEIYFSTTKLLALYEPFYTLSQRLSKQTASKITKDGKLD